MPRLGSLLRVLGLVSLAGVASACAGAETQDVLLDPNAPSSSGTSGTIGGSSSGTSGSSGSSGSSGTSSGGTETGSTDCEQEDEPNDGKQAANVLDPARCGTLSKSDQKDFLKFRLKSDTRTLSITFTGRVRLRIDVRGESTVELTPDSAGVVPFVNDEDYSVEVSALTETSSSVPWRVAIIEKP